MIRSPDREVVPVLLCPEDPAAGDEARYDPGSAENARRCGIPLDDIDHARLDRAFFDAYLDVLAGRRTFSDPRLLHLAAQLGLDRPLKHDRRPARIAEVEVPDETLTDVVEDFAPEFHLIVERITGDPDTTSVAAVAALLFMGVGVEGRRPLDLWADEKTDRALVRSARVIAAAPPCLYRDGRALLPFSPRWTPSDGPMGVYVARAYPVADRWCWSCRVDLRAEPDASVVLRRLTLEMWRFRRHERRASFEDLLRGRPEVLYRSAAEGACTPG